MEGYRVDKPHSKCVGVGGRWGKDDTQTVPAAMVSKHDELQQLWTRGGGMTERREQTTSQVLPITGLATLHNCRVAMEHACVAKERGGSRQVSTESNQTITFERHQSPWSPSQQACGTHNRHVCAAPAWSTNCTDNHTVEPDCICKSLFNQCLCDPHQHRLITYHYQPTQSG